MLRVLSFNLHQGLAHEGPAFAGEAAAALRERQPDVVACQEVLVPDGVPEEEGLAARLGEELGMHVVFGANAVVRRGLLGNATYTADPPRRWDNLDVSVGGHERRGVLRTVLDGGILVCNLHFGLTWWQRGRQWRKLIASLPPEGPTLVCGDFNDWPGLMDRYARRRGFANVLATRPRRYRRTFPAHRPLFALDRIYARDLSLLRARVLGGEPWDALSDHRPVEADFELDA